MTAEVALVRLLRDAGVDGRTAKWLAWLVDQTSDFPEGSDGLAGALLRWRRREALDAYEAGLRTVLDLWTAASDLLPEMPPVPNAKVLLRHFQEQQIDPGVVWDQDG